MASSTSPMSRRNSLRLPPQPPPIPIPPSLRQSPYLNAPIFKRHISTPRLPTDADERWLQDTVPLSPPAPPATESARSSADRRGSVAQHPARHPASLNHVHPLPSSGLLTPVADAVLPPSPASTSRRSSSAHRYLAHSLAPPPDASDRLHIGYAGRPVQLNQAHSSPSIPRLGGTSADQAYLCVPR